MPKCTASPTEPAPSPGLKYIHPVDLLKYRLRYALEDASQLVEVTLDNYELYEYEFEGHRMCTHRLRADAYCDDPRKRFYSPAARSLKLALPSAIGIGESLRWGMAERAGTFETELRATLDGLNSYVGSFPDMPLLPILRSCFAKWEGNLEKAWKLAAELEHVAVESRDPAEWRQALRDVLDEVRSLHFAFYDYHLAAKDTEADLTRDYDRLIAAMDLVEDRLVRIGPRLLHAMDDHEDASSLVEHFTSNMTQCRGNLYRWRAHGDTKSRFAPNNPTKVPSV
jgi:hypothetical protein